MTVTRLLARWRVTLGFVAAAVTLWFASPSWTTLAVGGVVAAIGEALRVWAAGHLEKSREVTSSGPYRLTRHPLYLGSSIVGLGFAVASGSVIVAIVAVAYLAATLTAAMRAEEAHLREKFGDAYDAYTQRRHAAVDRAWSWARAVHNREHHTVAGAVAGWLLLAGKVVLGGS